MRRFFYKISTIVSSDSLSSITATEKNKASLRITPKDFMKHIYSLMPAKALSVLILLLVTAFCGQKAYAVGTVAFVNGSPQSLGVCQNAAASSINTLLVASDNTAGETLIWSIQTAPSHGSLGGFNTSATSIVGNSTPTGLTYTPTGGYSGSDAFIIRVTNGTSTAFTTVNVTVTATVTPSVTIGLNTSTHICAGTNVTFTATPVNGGAAPTYQWLKNGGNVGVGGTTYSDNGLITSDVITVAMTSNANCASPTIVGSNSATMTVDPVPTVNAVTTQNVCNNATEAVTFTGAVGGTVYSWTNSNTAIGLAATGTGNLNFTATNAGSTAISGNIVVTPSHTNAGLTCTGTTTSFAINVNPTPNITSGTSTSICSGTSPNFSLTSDVTSSFAWTLGTNTGSITGASNASGSSINQTLTNPSNSTAGSIVYNVTATSTVGSCASSVSAVTVTVNPIPSLNSATTASICSGATTSVGLTATASSTFAWTLGTNTGTIGGPAAGSGNTISQTLTNPSNSTAGSIVYAVTPTSTVGSCVGSPTNVTVTVNPLPSLNSATTASICSGATTSVGLTATASSTFAWTLGTNTGTIGGPAAGSGSTIAQTLTNPSNSTPGSIVYVVTPTSTVGSCAGPSTNVTVTVNPLPSLNSATTASICSGGTTSIGLTATASSTFAWTLGTNTGSIGGPAAGSGNTISQTLTNPSNATAGSIIYAVTPTSTVGSCAGSATNVTVTVNPIPGVTTTTTTSLCSGTTTGIALTATTGSSFAWTLGTITGGITGASGGSGNTISQTLVNPSNATAGTVPYIVTPTSTVGSCVGAPATITATVNPIPNVTSTTSSTICSGFSPAISLTATASSTFAWTLGTNTGGITGATASSGSTINQTLTNPSNSTAGSIVYIVTPTSTGGLCAGPSTNVTVTVNPTLPVSVTMTPNTSNTICSGTSVTFTATPVNGGTTPTYQWYKNNILVGTGNPFTYSSTINTGDVFNTTMTTNAICPSSPTAASNSVTFTVVPTPTVNAVSSQTVCNGTSTTAITFSGTPAGTVYNWTNNTTSIGLAATGTGNIGAFTATNAGGTVQTALVTVTPSYTSGITCQGTPSTFNITVNPTPTAIASSNPTVCNGAAAAAVTFSGNVAGAVYTWSNNTPSIGLAASGVGNIASFIPTNSGNTPLIATVTVTPSFTNNSVTCTGTAQSFTYTDNPIPTVNAVSNQTLCGGSNTNPVTFSGFVAGTTYNWTNSASSIGLASSGSGNIASFTAVNFGASPVTGNITVTPVANGCTGSNGSFSITVNNAIATSISIAANPTGTICAGTQVTFTASIGGGGSTPSYQWQKNGINTGTNSSVYVDNNLNNNDAITCTMASSAFCPTPPTITSNTITMSVNSPASVTSQPLASSVCAGSNTSFSIAASGAGLSYQWQANGVNISNGAQYSGVTTNTLSITGAGSVLNGTQYRCVVTGTCTPSTNSNAALLTVYTSPSTSNPPNTSVCAGSNTTISVSATGSGLTYQWMVNQGAGYSNLSNGGVYSNVNTNTLTITSAVSAMNGYQYQCVVSGFCTPPVTSGSATLTVNSLPSINVQPVNTNVCANGTTSFSVSASGSGLTYQWKLNGSTTVSNGGVYSGATSNTLVITGATAGMNGNTYQCIVSGTCTPAANSNVVTLSVYTPVVIGTQPQNTTVCVGSNTTISVILTSGAPNTYQWQVNNGGGFVNVSGASYSGGTTNVLTINNAALSMSGYTYQCIISNPCSLTSTTSIATLTVNTLPAITSNPNPNTVLCAGSNTTMSTTATGSNLTYQWKVNGSNVTNGGVYSGATTNTLTFTNITAGMNGNVYQCVVSGYCTPSVTTTNDTLRVNTLPAVFTQPVNATVCAGSNTSFFDSSTGTGVTYQWQVNTGSGFNNVTNGGVYSGATTSTLSITGATAGMTGYTYKCIASGTCSPVASSNTVSLTVNTLPAITGQPAGRTIVCAGSNTSMADTATGTNLTYQWFLNGSLITNTPPYSGALTNKLIITGATAGMNGGIYTCVVSGACSPSVTTTNDTLQVNTLPAVVTQPINSTLCAGGNTSFFDSSTGTGISYQWQVNTGSGFNNITNGGVYSGATGTTLSLTGVTAGMNGYQYKCVTTGTCAPVANSSVVTLTVNTAPVIGTQPGTNGRTVTCVGTNTPLTIAATGTALTYQWQVDTGTGFNNIANGPVYSGALASTLNILSPVSGMTSYRYRCIVSGTCTPVVTSNTDTLTVNTLPSITGQPSNDTICAGNNATFSITANGTGATYQWYENTGSGFTAISNGGVYSGATTNSLTLTGAPFTMNGYQYRCVVSGACTPVATSTTGLLTVYRAPLVGTQSPALDTVCVGSNISLFVNATGTALTYQWQVNTGAGFTNITSGGPYSGFTSPTLTITNATAGMNNYRYQCIVSGACTPNSASGSMLLTVNTLPTIVTQPVSTPVCVGSNAQFSITATGTALIYVWQVNTGSGFTTVSNGGVYSGATSHSLIISGAPITMNGYQYRCIISGSCTPPVTSNTDTLTVNVLPPSTITAAGPTSFCPNGSVILSANTGSNIVSYQWKLDTVSISNATSTSYSANAIGNYTCVVTNISGCSTVSNIIAVTHYAAPNAVITPASSTTFCTGGSVVLNANNGTNLSYQWKLNGINIPGASANTYTANATGAYTVQVTNQNSCSTLSSTTYVIVNPAPQSFITAVGNTSFCQGQHVNLVASTGFNYSYAWYLNGVAIPGATGSTYTDTASGVVTVKVTDTANCSTTSAGTLVLSNPYPSLALTTASGSTIICDSSTLLIQATTVSGTSYQWITNNVPIFGATYSNYAADAAGTYYVKLTSSAGCSDTTGIILTMDTMVNPIITPIGGDSLCTGSFASIINWYFNGNPIPGTTNMQCIYAPVSGSYTVEVKDAASCGKTSAVYNQVVSAVKNVNVSKDDVRLYPNPATSVLHIDAKTRVNVAILNLQGQTVLQQSDAKDVDITSLANGVYMIQVYDLNHMLIKTERMIKNGL